MFCKLLLAPSCKRLLTRRSRLVLRWGEEAVMEIYTTESAGEQQPEWSKVRGHFTTGV